MPVLSPVSIRRAAFAAAIMPVLAAAVAPAHAESWFDSFFRRSGEPQRPPVSSAQPPARAPAAPAPKAAVAPAPAPAAAPAPVPAPVALPRVPVAYPRVQKVAEFLEIIGAVTPVNDVKLVARVPGYLESVHYLDGEIVEPGHLLFTIQQDQYKVQVAQAEAQVRAIEAAVAYARLEAERYQALQRKGAAAQVVVDNWNFQATKSEADLAAARGQLELAQLNLSYTEVRAPFAGQMSRQLLNVGSMVGAPGQPSVLAEIVQLDPIYVVANVSERDFIAYRNNVGQKRLTLAEMREIPIDIALEGDAQFHLRGKLEYVSPTVDQQTGTVMVRGIVHNPDRSLVPGLAVRLRLPRGEVIPNATLVPDRAVQADQQGRYVLVVNKQGLVEKRHIQLGELIGGLRLVTDGIRPDDRVVIGDLWRATPGIKVDAKLVPIDQALTAAGAGQ